MIVARCIARRGESVCDAARLSVIAEQRMGMVSHRLLRDRARRRELILALGSRCLPAEPMTQLGAEEQPFRRFEEVSLTRGINTPNFAPLRLCGETCVERAQSGLECCAHGGQHGSDQDRARRRTAQGSPDSAPSRRQARHRAARLPADVETAKRDRAAPVSELHGAGARRHSEERQVRRRRVESRSRRSGQPQSR